MKRGQKVAVCYDGKWGRRIPGVVTATKNGHHIKVRFTPRGQETEVEAWFRATRRGRSYGGVPKYFVGWVKYDGAFMPSLFQTLGATALGDWYSVYKWSDD